MHPGRDLLRGTLAAIRRDLAPCIKPEDLIASSHSATFTYDEADGVWLVEFPGLVGCHTYGETLEEARANAREALQVWLDQDDVEIEEEIHPRIGATG